MEISYHVPARRDFHSCSRLFQGGYTLEVSDWPVILFSRAAAHPHLGKSMPASLKDLLQVGSLKQEGTTYADLVVMKLRPCVALKSDPLTRPLQGPRFHLRSTNRPMRCLSKYRNPPSSVFGLARNAFGPPGTRRGFARFFG